MDRKQGFLHQILDLVRQAGQASSQEGTQMRAQFRQERPIGGIVTGKTPRQQIPQAFFPRTKPGFPIHSLHRCLWLQRPGEILADASAEKILPEPVTICHPPPN
jgi:hypothetical protein